MEWSQILTIIISMLTIVISILVPISGMFFSLKKDMSTINEHHRQDIKEMRKELIELRNGFTKVHELWTDLTKKVYGNK